MKSSLSEKNYSRQSHMIVNAKYAFSRNEIDLLLTLLTAIDKDDKDFKDYCFDIKELNSKTSKEWNSVQLQETVESLFNKSLKIEISKSQWKLFNWFSYFEYNRGVITCRFDKGLKPYLLDIKKRFVISDLRMILPMRSSYSKRIYLLLKEYAKIGERKFNVEELQDMLLVPNSHKERYNKFKVAVLKRAETDINKFTDLEVKLLEKKRARKVVEVTYTIRKNEVDLKSFIAIIREMYVNKLLYHSKDGRPIKCSDKGLLYYSDTNQNINKKDSLKLWEYLHEHREHLECYEKIDKKEILKKMILSDINTFMNYLKENYVNQDIFKKVDNTTRKEMMVSISYTGDLYDKISGEYFDERESYNLWNQIYRFAQLGKLDII